MCVYIYAYTYIYSLVQPSNHQSFSKIFWARLLSHDLLQREKDDDKWKKDRLQTNELNKYLGKEKFRRQKCFRLFSANIFFKLSCRANMLI